MSSLTPVPTAGHTPQGNLVRVAAAIALPLVVIVGLLLLGGNRVLDTATETIKYHKEATTAYMINPPYLADPFWTHNREYSAPTTAPASPLHANPELKFSQRQQAAAAASELHANPELRYSRSGRDGTTGVDLHANPELKAAGYAPSGAPAPALSDNPELKALDYPAIRTAPAGLHANPELKTLDYPAQGVPEITSPELKVLDYAPVRDATPQR